MSKTFVIDTSVLLFDPHSIFKFQEHNVFIPLVVVEEIDKFKRSQDENGRNARCFSRLVDELRQGGSLAKGVDLEGGGKLFIAASNKTKTKEIAGIDLSINDNLILAQALYFKEKGEDTWVISKDINLRVKADALELAADDYLSQNADFDNFDEGARFFEVAPDRLALFESERFLELTQEELASTYPNEYVILCETNNKQHRKLARFCNKKKGLVPLIPVRDGIWGIYPKNPEQQFALDALMNNDVQLVSLLGKAGTGKTLLAIAAGLEQTVNKDLYQKLLVSRPIMPMGRDLGFLPGDIDEKLGPWMRPIFDNIDFLFDTSGSSSGTKDWEDLINKGILHVEPLTYIRGRTLPNQYMIVDEAQNLSPHEIKTIITRAGEGTKIVLTGDVDQIDNPYLDTKNNGLVYCMDRLRSETIVAHTQLMSGERSPLSEMASQKL